MQPYKDADEFIKNKGEKEFEKILRNAITPEEFEISYYSEHKELFNIECVRYWKNASNIPEPLIIREIEEIKSKKDLINFVRNA